MDIKLENPCNERKNFCINCNSHFMELRPLLKEVVVSKHFKRDLKDKERINSIIKNILDCSNLEFTELHKFEENIEGNMIFRAKKENMHIIYCIDKNMRIIFLRAIKNFDEYRRLLENKKELKLMIEV
jgi:mRNA-degrading endonuclease RelE of RelBE toxin-antitoxin system